MIWSLHLHGNFDLCSLAAGTGKVNTKLVQKLEGEMQWRVALKRKVTDMFLSSIQFNQVWFYFNSAKAQQQ